MHDESQFILATTYVSQRVPLNNLATFLNKWLLQYSAAARPIFRIGGRNEYHNDAGREFKCFRKRLKRIERISDKSYLLGSQELPG